MAGVFTWGEVASDGRCGLDFQDCGQVLRVRAGTYQMCWCSGTTPSGAPRNCRDTLEDYTSPLGRLLAVGVLGCVQGMPCELAIPTPLLPPGRGLAINGGFLGCANARPRDMVTESARACSYFIG